MKVYLATVADETWSRELRAEMTAVAIRDRFGEHELAASAASADIVLFVDAQQHLPDWRMRGLRTHPLVREREHDAFVYDQRDLPRGLLPGVFVALPASRFDRRRQRACGYYRLTTDTRGVRDEAPDLLFSFQGREFQGARQAVLALDHPRALIEDTSRHDFFAGDDPVLEGAQQRYRDVIGRSKFVLCPRGAGTSSFRLFETLAAGRVPVILSDDWVEPDGVDWPSCSVRVREADAAAVPDLLTRLEPGWSEMGAAAAAVYDEWFAPDVWFHHVVESCAEIRESGRTGLAPQWRTRAYWRDAARHWRAVRRARAGRG